MIEAGTFIKRFQLAALPYHHLDLQPIDICHQIASLFSRREATPPLQSIYCLSVRTAFDLYLAALGLPKGSEVLVSAITHPDMVRIIEMHGLVAVPVDIDPETLLPISETLQNRISERSRILLVAHLFGARSSLDECIAFALANDLLVVEDVAQSMCSGDDRGDARADVTLFSFGFIKTATA